MSSSRLADIKKGANLVITIQHVAQRHGYWELPRAYKYSSRTYIKPTTLSTSFEETKASFGQDLLDMMSLPSNKHKADQHSRASQIFKYSMHVWTYIWTSGCVCMDACMHKNSKCAFSTYQFLEAICYIQTKV